MQQSRREVELAIGLCLLAPALLAPDLAGLAPFVLCEIAATIGSPIAVALLWVAWGRHLKALGGALLITCAGVLFVGVLIVLVVVVPVAPSTRGDTVPYVADQALLFSILPAAIAFATSLVLLPFAWGKTRSNRGGRLEM